MNTGVNARPSQAADDSLPKLGTHVDPDYKPAINGHAQRLIERIKRNHLDAEAVFELAAHYETHRDFPSLANLMQGWAPTLRDDRKAADAYIKAGDAALQGTADIDRARELYECALERYPEHDVALSRLEELLRGCNDDAGLERCFSHVTTDLARRNAHPKLRAGVHLRFGQHYESRMQMPGRAVAQYKQALQLDPTLIPAIAAARGIYLASNKAAAVADMYEMEIAATPELKDRHTLLVALANHQSAVLGDVDNAVLALRRALKAVPSEPQALELLAGLLHKRGEQGSGEEAEADLSRAAELYYQVARSVPRKQAQPRLVSCLQLQPEHSRALRMLAELNAYGAGNAGVLLPAAADIAQAEIDVRATGRHSPAQLEQIAVERDDAAALEMAAWLDDDAIVMIDQDVGPEDMVPVTERPPPLKTL